MTLETLKKDKIQGTLSFTKSVKDYIVENYGEYIPEFDGWVVSEILDEIVDKDNGTGMNIFAHYSKNGREVRFYQISNYSAIIGKIKEKNPTNDDILKAITVLPITQYSSSLNTYEYGPYSFNNVNILDLEYVTDFGGFVEYMVNLYNEEQDSRVKYKEENLKEFKENTKKRKEEKLELAKLIKDNTITDFSEEVINNAKLADELDKASGKELVKLINTQVSEVATKRFYKEELY